MENDLLLQRFFDRLNEHISVAPSLRLVIAEELAIRHIPENKALSGYLGDLHFVMNGFVIKKDENGSILEFIPEGEFIFRTDMNDGARFICKTHSTIATLSQDGILAILKNHVIFYRYINMIFNAVLTKRQIRSKLLTKSIAQRKKLFYRMYPDVAANRPMYEIASYLGSNVNYFGSI